MTRADQPPAAAASGAATGAVRLAALRDVPAVLALIRELAAYEREPDAVEATEAMLGEALFGADPRVFSHVVDHADGTGSPSIAGFALWYVTFSTWQGRHGIWLEDLFVRPEHRGRGYGHAMLVELARICVERGYGRLEWCVLDWNEPALGFYRSLGAEPMGQWTVQRASGEVLTRLAARPRERPLRAL